MKPVVEPSMKSAVEATSMEATPMEATDRQSATMEPTSATMGGKCRGR